IDSEGHRVIKHPWMRYFFNVIPNRNYNPFHLVDMYLKIGGVRTEGRGLIYQVAAADEERAGLILKREGVREGEMLVGFHLGASKSDKTWPVSSYSELADMIVEAYGARIVLFGSPGEADLAARFETCVHAKPVNLVGKTNVGELAAILRTCGLFISNDTGPLHIATSVGTRVIDISTANVHFMETGPYGEGHYVIQADLPCVPCGFDVTCTDMICKSFIKPAAVFEIVRGVLSGDDTRFNENIPAWNNVQVYRSHFGNDGYLGFAPLIKRHMKKETLYCMLYRQLWNMEDEKTSGDDEAMYNGISREMSYYEAVDDSSELLRSFHREIDIIAELSDKAGQGLDLVSSIAEEAAKGRMDIGKIKGIWQELEIVDRRIELIGHTNPCFRPLTLIFMYAKEALEGNDLVKISAASKTIYGDLTDRAVNMHKLMKTALYAAGANNRQSAVHEKALPDYGGQRSACI
ncbi:MAG: glycosyltransferase family 9 protein, partial [Nitrospirota bacterium]